MSKTKICRLGEEKYNYQGCLMKIVKYNRVDDIIIEFQDKHRARVHSTYRNFVIKKIKNPYYPSVFNVGIVGNKHPKNINGRHTKEYEVWHNMIERCYSEKFKKRCEYYKDVTCCEEWLLFDNFFKWLHEQPNFEKWLNNDDWNLDKDILVKGNKIYSPETCCLVPKNVNTLFTKCDKARGNLPIGIYANDRYFIARCRNPLNNGKKEFLGAYFDVYNAFLSYKKYKESIIKQVAQIEYDKENITEKCYNAMMNYEVKIDD